MNLGILNLGIISLHNETSVDVINTTFQNVITAEKLGFKRYWFAEHHAPDTAWRNTSLMVILAAGYTDTIKVGTAGVILKVNNPYRIANDFRLASSLYEDRIELGLSRGTVSKDYLEHLFYDKSTEIEDSDEKYEDLIKFIHNKHEVISVPPYDIKPPNVIALGSSSTSMNYSIKYNIDLCISVFHGTELNSQMIENIKIYRDQFFKINKRLPCISLCFAGVCANNEDLAKKRLKEFLPDNSTWDVNIIGTPDKIKNYIYNISSSTGIVDFIYCDLSQSIYHEEHIHSISSILK